MSVDYNNLGFITLRAKEASPDPSPDGNSPSFVAKK